MKVSYDRTTRDRAKGRALGLVTIEYITADGLRSTTQLVASSRVAAYARRATNHLLKLVREED